jgi:hypothetical protein
MGIALTIMMKKIISQAFSNGYSGKQKAVKINLALTNSIFPTFCYQ